MQTTQSDLIIRPELVKKDVLVVTGYFNAVLAAIEASPSKKALLAQLGNMLLATYDAITGGAERIEQPELAFSIFKVTPTHAKALGVTVPQAIALCRRHNVQSEDDFQKLLEKHRELKDTIIRENLTTVADFAKTRKMKPHVVRYRVRVAGIEPRATTLSGYPLYRVSDLEYHTARPQPQPTPAVTNPSPAVSNPSPAVSNPSPAVTNPSPAVSNPSPAVSNPFAAFLGSFQEVDVEELKRQAKNNELEITN